MDDPIRFHADENIPDSVVSALRHRQVSITTTDEVGLSGATDSEQLAWAVREGRVLLTRDWDFVEMHWRDSSHAGIAYASQRLSIGKILEALDLLIGATTATQMQGHLEFLDRLTD